MSLKNRAGLDIGSSSIKVLELSDGQGKNRISGIGLKDISSVPKQAVPEAVKQLVAEAKVAATEFNIAISGSSVIARFLSMPKMTDEELRNAVRFEAEKVMPFNINDCIVDLQVLARHDKENKLDTVFIAAKKAVVEEKLKIVEGAGFSVSVVDVESFALSNSFLRNFPGLDKDKTVAVVNIGAATTNLSVVKNDAVCLVRDIAIGGNDLKTAVSVKSILANLLSELRLSCSYYENQSGRSVDEFYFSGGACSHAGLNEFFQESLNTKVNYWNPLKFAEADGKAADMNIINKENASFAVCAGLALR